MSWLQQWCCLEIIPLISLVHRPNEFHNLGGDLLKVALGPILKAFMSSWLKSSINSCSFYITSNEKFKSYSRNMPGQLSWRELCKFRFDRIIGIKVRGSGISAIFQLTVLTCIPGPRWAWSLHQGSINHQWWICFLDRKFTNMLTA